MDWLGMQVWEQIWKVIIVLYAVPDKLLDIRTLVARWKSEAFKIIFFFFRLLVSKQLQKEADFYKNFIEVQFVGKLSLWLRIIN